jgi:hypothetical protein
MESIATLEKKLKIKKMDAHIDEMAIQKLRLMEKVNKLDSEIELAKTQIEEIKQELGE